MILQFGSSNNFSVLKKDNSFGLSEDLFLNSKKKKNKATYEIQIENGYVRHYIIKANGERVMIKEKKLPKTNAVAEGNFDTKDIINEVLMNQLSKVLDKEQYHKFSKIGFAAQKEKLIEKYL